MAPHFEVDPAYPRSKYDFNGTWLYRVEVTVGTFGSFYLVDGAGLTGKSNAEWAVPNSPSAFIGQTGQAARRKVEVYALTGGVYPMIEFSATGASQPTVSMQVKTVDLPNAPRRFVRPSAPAVAVVLDERGFREQYHLNSNIVVKTGPPETLFDPVPNGIVHVVLSTHGRMDPNTRELSLSIAGGINRTNCSAVFGKLKQKNSQGGVVWISGCEAGGDIQFCQLASQASGFYIVAAEIVVPFVPLSAGMIDYFERSMIKFFNPKNNGNLMPRSDFLSKQKELQFTFVV